MSNHAITDAENSLVKAEPAIALHAGGAILGYIGTLLVTHGVITHDQASALTQQVLPAVVAGLLVLLGVVVRRVVAPAALFAQRVEEEVQKRLEGAAPTVTAGASGQPYTLTLGGGTATNLPPDVYASAISRIARPAQSAADDPIQVSPSDFLPADIEVPAAAEPAPDGALPIDPAPGGAHAADSAAPPA